MVDNESQGLLESLQTMANSVEAYVCFLLQEIQVRARAVGL